VDFHDAATLPQHPNIGLGLALVVFMKSFALGLIVGLVLAAPLVSILFLLQAIVGTPFRLDARNFTYASFRLDLGFMAVRLAIPTRKTRLSRALLRWSRSCTNRGSSGTAPERRQRHLQRPAKPLRDSSKAQAGRVDHVSRSQSKRKHTTAPRQQRHQKSMDVDWGFRRAGRTHARW
jgi:hypothetical protein